MRELFELGKNDEKLENMSVDKYVDMYVKDKEWYILGADGLGLDAASGSTLIRALHIRPFLFSS